MARIPGVGLAKGLSITLRHMLRRSVTQQYPEVKPDLPPRSRGVIALVEENCTSCMLCARECPDWCIYIDSHKETIPAPEGGRARQRNVLDRFAIDFALCMYCGICIEVCPFDALFWAPEFEYAEGDIRNLLHEKDKLATWVEAVPPPPAHDAGAEPPKELTAAPRRPAADRPARTPAAQRPRTATPTRPAVTEDQEPATSAEAAPGTTTGESAPAAPEPGQDTPASRRPRRPMTNVRGIRPPGALPSREQPRPQEEGSAQAPGEASSTGRQPADELSTGTEKSRPEPGNEEQTSAPSPRRRRMADPRSIRPPGRLGPDDPKEPEEES
ncbi:formate hydrogenlyase subunit 6/NADH:ubiquinone oxidoreductase subunit I [Nonomuraea thailandensis]|uniref:NADH-quinone oxidoreductase subunit I n=1 Tax=Nonomuraea thailandensis TaxID=1188745 RepID=A0A9X2GRV3_9ACTN|nr:4Fe-4S binding protein [Nonomuraea thailandensis]MCP2362657.1 formate hydrogenlyase subunit 6/NADH:ubiquinone oxidoreductase subunit I [Nonomuraea thailandensis]